MPRAGLTQKQENFCLHYFETSNATESAKLAGYSPKTAAAIACDNLRKVYVLARIAELRQKAEDTSIATVVERKQKLTEITRGNLTDYQEAGADGSYISIGKESPNTGAVSEITSRTEYNDDGANAAVITKVKLHNPVQAIAELNKMERVYEPDGAVTIHNNQVTIIVASEQGKRDLERVMNGERT